MPTLDWLNRATAFTTAARVPYRLPKPASTLDAPTRNSKGRCLFGQITKERAGVGTAGQLDALLA